tara:strand:+ start:401 stop:658 length:258 start_codon:yes stop_codon:yes gene_type:complete
MKKVLLSMAVAAFLVSCGGAETTEKSAIDVIKEDAAEVKNAGEKAVEDVKTVVEETPEAPGDTAETTEISGDTTEVETEVEKTAE